MTRINERCVISRTDVNRGISFCHPTKEIYRGNTETEEFVENSFGQKEPNTKLVFYRKVNN